MYLKGVDQGVKYGYSKIKSVPDGTFYVMSIQHSQFESTILHIHNRKGHNTREVGYAILIKHTR